jgi:peptidoglycan/LPS O-acetylase OafA/YrhL
VERNNNFNFLRLFLAVLVLLSHSPELIDGNRKREILSAIFHTFSCGELAVKGFFLISGYLIIQSWQRNPQLFDYFKKRVLRIYPGFIIATLISAFVVAPLGANLSDYLAQFKPWKFVLGMLFLERPVIPPVFVGQPYPDVNGSMWTIAYEFRCYLLVAVLGMCGIFQRRSLWLAFSVFILVIYMTPGLADRIDFPGSSLLMGNFPKFVGFLVFFCAGGCFYLWRDRIHYNTKLALIFLPIVILSLFKMKVAQLLLPTMGGYILFWFVFAPLPIFQQFAKRADISYGVYLYGWPIQKLLLWYIPSLSPWLLFLLSCAISFPCGWLSWNLVESPFMKLKGAKIRDKKAPAP